MVTLYGWRSGLSLKRSHIYSSIGHSVHCINATVLITAIQNSDINLTHRKYRIERERERRKGDRDNFRELYSKNHFHEVMAWNKNTCLKSIYLHSSITVK